MQTVSQLPVGASGQYYQDFVSQIGIYARLSSLQYQFVPCGLAGSSVLLVPVTMMQQSEQLQRQQPQQQAAPSVVVRQDHRQDHREAYAPVVRPCDEQALQDDSAQHASSSQQHASSSQQHAAQAATALEQQSSAGDAATELQWGRNDVPATVPAPAADAHAEMLMSLALSASPTGKQVLSALIERCTSGDLSSAGYAKRFARDLSVFFSAEQPAQRNTRGRVQQTQQRDAAAAAATAADTAECPICGEMLLTNALVEHLTEELEAVNSIEQQYLNQQVQQTPSELDMLLSQLQGQKSSLQPAQCGDAPTPTQHANAAAPTAVTGDDVSEVQPGSLLYGMQQLLDTIVAQVKQLVEKAFGAKEPSTALLTLNQGIWQMQLDVAEHGARLDQQLQQPQRQQIHEDQEHPQQQVEEESTAPAGQSLLSQLAGCLRSAGLAVDSSYPDWLLLLPRTLVDQSHLHEVY